MIMFSRTLSKIRHSFKIGDRTLFTSTTTMQDTRPPGHTQRRIDHLKMMNYSMTVDEQKVEATVRTNGLHYTDFDSKNGLPKPWQLMKMLESARFFSHHWPLDDSGRTFRDYAEMTSERMTFLVTSSFDIEPEMYDFTRPKSPLDIKVKGGHVGNSSLNSVATIMTTDGHALLRNINQVVMIDRNTRKSALLPKWWAEKYRESGKETPSLIFRKFEKPDDLTPFKVRVVRSDLDGNNHTNWSCYVRFSLDALYYNAKHGLVKNFDDLEKRGLRRMELLYIGESFDDDNLDVYAWTDANDMNKVFVHIEKESKHIFQGTYFYHDKPLY